MNTLKSEIKPNELQQKCIDSLEGKYLVLAGPGTGKTFTVIERIKNMLLRGINPAKILCLTYSDAAASEMKSRLAKKLNKLDCGVDIFTYHSFCNSIINDNFEEFELSENYRIITPSISKQFIKECIDELNPKEYRSKRNDPYVYLKPIQDRIEQIKKHRYDKKTYFENIKTNPDWEPKIKLLENELKNQTSKRKPEKIQQEIEEIKKNILKAQEIWEFYELYKNKTEQNHFIDFDDMISFVLDKFKQSPVFLDKIANKYDYILVDEYQDTNISQNEILFNIIDASNKQNIFVVGDDDQIIYTFQGARLDIIEKFLDKYPDTKVICLRENLRSTQNILDCARNIAKQDNKRLEVNPKFKDKNIDKNLIAKNEKLYSKNSKVTCTKYFDVNQEYLSIANEIENIINSNLCPLDDEGKKDLSQIAILTKSNKELEKISIFLKNRNIPYELKDGKNIFEIKSSIVFYYYLKMLVNPELNSDKILKLLLLEPFKIQELDYIKILEKRSINKSFIESMKEIDDFIDKDRINSFINTFDYLNKYQTNESLKNIIIETGAKTGIFDYFINSKINKMENIAGLKKIIDEAMEFCEIYKKISLADFVEYLDIALNDEIPILTSKAPVIQNAVQLSTYHSSKGREFEYVFMPTLLRSNWEKDISSYKPIIPVSCAEYKTKEELDEIKRSDKIKLMYVGLTRAKHTLRLSYVENSGRRAAILSEFISNIQDILELRETLKYTNESYLEEQKEMLLKKEYDYNRDFCAFIDSKIKDKHFSPTSINTYLNCPRQFLYEYILDLSSKAQNINNLLFGSAIHNALEYMCKNAKEKGEYPKKEEYIKIFENKLKIMPLDSMEQKEILLKRGKDALDRYYSNLISANPLDIFDIEYKINYEEDNYKFNGIIDRIDKNKDGSCSIYDYKTGSAKKESEISPDGDYQNYYNQIALYKYFFEKATNNKVSKTGFIFVEESKSNLYLNLSDEECKAVVQKFKSAIDNIRSYNFEANKSEKSCKYCQYKDFCKVKDTL